MKDHGCYQSLPHHYETVWDSGYGRGEVCKICGHYVKWKLDKQGRPCDGEGYYQAHIRNFAQSWGETAQIYYACWHPELYDQMSHLWTISVCVSDDCWPFVNGKREFRCRHSEAVKQWERDLGKAGTNGQKQEEVSFYTK